MKLCGNVVGRGCGGGSVYIIEGNGKSCAFVHVKRNDLPGVRSEGPCEVSSKQRVESRSVSAIDEFSHGVLSCWDHGPYRVQMHM